MQIDSGMTPQRDWADYNSRVRERSTRFVLPSPEFLAAATVFAAVILNATLAGLNANVFYIGRVQVIVAEVLVVAVALALCARSFNRLMIPWISVIWLIAILFLILSVFRQSLEPKYIRDVLLIPVFIALGTTFVKGNIVKLFATLQAVIFAIMIFEGVFTDLYGRAFNPLMYYVNSREKSLEAFWNPDSLLYYSSFRPVGHGRFFDWFTLLGTHRLSSVFLEPVSFGNWCIVMTIFLTAFWRDLSRKAAVLFVLSTIAMLIGSDGRLATGTIVVIVAIAIFAPRLPRYSYFFYLPGAAVASFILVAVFDPPMADNFLGRLAFSISILSKMDLFSILGFDSVLTKGSADSGISYFILTQSIIGLAVFWVAICFLQPPTSRVAKIFMHGACMYIALVLMISFSMFSIKTAAPLWFLYGYVRARNESIS